MSDAVASYLAVLDPADRAMLDALRAIVAGAAPDLVEEIKWNAPSFRDDADHKVTLGIERKGGLRVVLHRGTRKLDPLDLRALDTDGIAAWPATDRAVVTLADRAAIDAGESALAALVRRWIAATR